MIQILIRYATLFITTMLVLAALSFALAYLFPGDVLVNLTGITPQNEAQRAALIRQFQLDKPYLFQFIYYVQQLLQGNWGYSFISGLPLRQEIGIAMPATIELSAYALFIAIFVGVPLGCYAGLRSYTKRDYLINSASMVSYSFPVFWIALVFILFFSLNLGVVPLSGRVSLLFDVPPQTGFILIDIIIADSVDSGLALSDALIHLLLPTVSIALVSTASMVRLTRRSVIDVLKSPYIAAAESRGLSKRQIFFRHILRNALLPILPLMAIQITTLITNAMIVETLFSWPGIGNWLIQAIYQRDYPALRVGMLAVATVVISFTIMIDLFNRFIDPSREKYERGTV
ncbi:ABC transporter permease [Alteromonas sp. RKMC-009]|uniref:ABC transporter permease n=1 Tax=Alteromonas sp. RKMC-009 TaxID=2267264 RepID=UPI000C4F655E|nr:ABC transporter permease [Alteromonas sp. RKMC-009]AYA63746.1 ABC transporter permease [Alteromonas sp. RKMC-009]MBT80873.1 peptide ABC transporter permease [Alteromonadaceae bacterium]MEC7691032.1 ABC transporter permease [Pseudomonadota bacterium]